MTDLNKNVVTHNYNPVLKITFYILIWIISLVIIFVAGIIIGRLWQFSFDQNYALNSLAERLKVDNDPKKIREAVHCQLLALGASKSTIAENLKLVGRYQEFDSWNGATSIIFDDYFTQLTIHELVLIFEDNKLVEKSYSVTPDTTILIICS